MAWRTRSRSLGGPGSGGGQGGEGGASRNGFGRPSAWGDWSGYESARVGKGPASPTVFMSVPFGGGRRDCNRQPSLVRQKRERHGRPYDTDDRNLGRHGRPDDLGRH